MARSSVREMAVEADTNRLPGSSFSGVKFMKRLAAFLLTAVCCLAAGFGGPSHVPAKAAPTRQGPSLDILKRKIAVMESLGGGPLIGGNKVTLLINGPATYRARFEAIKNARDHIYLEIFSIEDNTRGRRFADLLIKKQAEGVQVYLMYDSAGSFHAPASFFERLRREGIRVLEFNPVNPFKARGAWRPARRDHRKVLITDGKIAITGGINFSQDYSTGPFPGEEEQKKSRMAWRDTDVQIEGPVVSEFEKNFIDTWIGQKGPAPPEKNNFMAAKEQGEDLVCAVTSFSGATDKIMYEMYLSVINSAEKSIRLTNTFFLPDERLQKALMEAAGRGVDVKIILPSFSDNPVIFHAGRYYYSKLLRSGVKFYELRNAILHAKTAVIDGVWSTVGSTNIDYWSFFFDNEENAVIIGSRFAFEMEKMFADDIGESREIKQEEWEKRALPEKVKEWLAHLAARML